MSDSAPPGWYPDASAPGLERWWDGDRWSAVSRPVPSLEAPPAGPVAPLGPASVGPTPAPPAPWGQPPAQSYPAQYPDPRSAALPRATPDGVPLAGMGARLAARLIDFAVIALVGLALSFPSLRRVWIAVSAWYRDAAARAAAGGPITPDTTALTNDPDVTNSMVVVSLIVLLVSAVYTIGFITARGATPGKLIAGIRVRPLDREGRPSFGQALLRWLLLDGPAQVLSYLGMIYFAVAALSPLWHPRRQGWHDRGAKTVVVSARAGRR